NKSLHTRFSRYWSSDVCSSDLVPITLDIEELAYHGPNAEILKPIFDELEFKFIAARVFNEGVATPKTTRPSQLSMFGPSDALERSEERRDGRARYFWAAQRYCG